VLSGEFVQDNFTASNATVTSKDGSVTVTVGPNGGLRNLQLGRRAMGMSAAQLTGAILRTAALAQRQAAEKLIEVFRPLGEGTEAMAMSAPTRAPRRSPSRTRTTRRPRNKACASSTRPRWGCCRPSRPT
jgi:hypothetical protein